MSMRASAGFSPAAIRFGNGDTQFLQRLLRFLNTMVVKGLILRGEYSEQSTELTNVLHLLPYDIQQDFASRLIIRGFRQLFIQLDGFILCGYHETDSAHQLTVGQLAISRKASECM